MPISVPSPNHFWFTRSAVKSRPARSGARHRPLPCRVAPLRFRFGLAANPRSRISAATVLTLTAQPASLRSAVIPGDPRLPWCAANSRATSAASAARRARRGEASPCAHL
ncbi:MAG TPA: hypothetical protein VMV92_21000 [Streptosporangiaceae bacterium]|nr:hypothetical protein [Streptosporangiaceae bacterium]